MGGNIIHYEEPDRTSKLEIAEEASWDKHNDEYGTYHFSSIEGSTLNPKPLNPKPRNPKPQYPKHETLNYPSKDLGSLVLGRRPCAFKMSSTGTENL